MQTERRLHSLYSAAKEIGVTVELLEPFLIEAGALPRHDTRFANRRVFSAVDHAELLAEVPTLVSVRTLKREIGASRTELERLIAEGVLVPRAEDENVRLRWSLVKARDLLSGLQAPASPVLQSEPGWGPLLAAGNRSRLSLAAVKLGPMNIKGGRLEYRRQKTAETNGVLVSLPLHPDLAELLATCPTDRPFLATACGKSRLPDGLGNLMHEWCDRAGLPESSSHGLRKACATRLAEAGASAHQIMAVTGHKTLAEVERYTASALRKDWPTPPLLSCFPGQIRNKPW